jgi:hypothetical protein
MQLLNSFANNSSFKFHSLIHIASILSELLFWCTLRQLSIRNCSEPKTRGTTEAWQERHITLHKPAIIHQQGIIIIKHVKRTIEASRRFRIVLKRHIWFKPKHKPLKENMLNSELHLTNLFWSYVLYKFLLGINMCTPFTTSLWILAYIHISKN